MRLLLFRGWHAGPRNEVLSPGWQELPAERVRRNLAGFALLPPLCPRLGSLPACGHSPSSPAPPSLLAFLLGPHPVPPRAWPRVDFLPSQMCLFKEGNIPPVGAISGLGVNLQSEEGLLWLEPGLW